MLSNGTASSRCYVRHMPHHIANKGHYTSSIDYLYLGIVCFEMALLFFNVVCVEEKQPTDFEVILPVRR